MSPDQLETLCGEYKALLRMRDWRIKIEFSDALCDDDHVGQVSFSADTQDAEIQILSGAAYAAGKQLLCGYDPEQILVHELLHAKLNEDCKEDVHMEFALDCIADALVALKRK